MGQIGSRFERSERDQKNFECQLSLIKNILPSVKFAVVNLFKFPVSPRAKIVDLSRPGHGRNRKP